MCQIADAVQQHGRGESGTGSGPDAGEFACSPFWQESLTVSSVYAEESVHGLTRDIHFDRCDCQRRGSDRDVDVSGRRYWRSVLYLSSTTKHTDYRPDAAFVLGVVAGDQSVQHIVASFPTRAISGVRTDGGGERSTTSSYLWAPADFENQPLNR